MVEAAEKERIKENTRRRRIVADHCRDLLERFEGNGQTWNGQCRAAIVAAFWRGYERGKEEA